MSGPLITRASRLVCFHIVCCDFKLESFKPAFDSIEMSQLEKLSIQGVRSFNPEKPQLIKFCPLTLILGVNGAGKTTIIEALRYVTSGEAPPGTDKGKTWIYDPRMQKSVSV